MKAQIKDVRSIKRELISLIVIMALVITGMSPEVMSKSVYATQESEKENKKAKEKATVVKELKEERTENSNTYLLSDGSKRTDIYSENVRYEENGKLVKYDSTLTALRKSDKQELKKIVGNSSTNEYIAVNARGKSKQYFPNTLNEESGIVMKNGRYEFSLIPLFLEIKENNGGTKIEESMQKDEKKQKFTPKIQENTITYTSETSDIKYEYTSLTNGVKEDIVINSKPDTNEFLFKIDTKKLEVELLDGYGGINLKDIKTGKCVGYIMPPNIIDAEGNVNYEDVKYILEDVGKENILKVVVNESYFDNENLAYPVKIDPTPVWFHSKLTTAVVCSASVVSNSNLHSENLYVNNKTIKTGVFEGSEQRVYLDTSNVVRGNCFIQGPGDISGKYIEKAELSVAEAEPKYTPGTVEIRKTKSEWNPQTITWDNQPEIEEEVIGSFICKGTENTRHSIDLTEWAQNIADGEENMGLVFTVEEGKGGSFKGPEVTHQGYMWLSITYCDMSAYDETVQMSAEYNGNLNKIDIKVEDYDKSSEGKIATSYQVFERKGEDNKFNRLASNTDLSKKTEIEADRIENTVDYRACVAYSDGTVTPSNIISFRKNDKTSNEGYTQITVDTDGDGLEDGYEIWDFKTKWNKKDDAGNYIVDSDGDGLPDGYEVFYQGTDPAVADDFTKDSDGDGLSNISEFHRGTDPHLYDSDFDGINDFNDYGNSNPRKTDNPNLNGTDQNTAYTSAVYIGPYDREYSEVKAGVTYSYIKNIYSGVIKQVRIDYGDSSLNKTMKYFYDAEGNNTAVVEQYDSEYDPSHEKTICVTYKYENDNIVFICDRETKYSMTYKNGKLKSFKIGDIKIAEYNDNIYMDKLEEIQENPSLALGDVIQIAENTVTYGNGQKVLKKTYAYKRASDDYNSTAYEVDIFYNTSTVPNYCIEYNIEGKILKLRDFTDGQENPIVYDYIYNEGNSYMGPSTSVVRNDNFSKHEYIKNSTNDETEEHIITKIIRYMYKGINENDEMKDYSTVSRIDKDNNRSVTVHLYDRDRYEYSNDVNNRVTTERIYSDEKQKYLVNFSKIKHDNRNISQTMISMHTDANGDTLSSNTNYTYNMAGNIIQIKKDNELVRKFSYDPHGKLTEEINYENHRDDVYEYDNVGNISKKITYNLDSSGNKVMSTEESINFECNNEQWREQLTKYNNEMITYDELGNPINFIDGNTMTWSRGRLLEKISRADNTVATYKYNENNFRNYKSTVNTTKTKGVNIVYEWDEDKLIRETNTDVATNKSYDIWYLYDDKGDMIGYDYIYLDTNNVMKSERAYFEKDINGSVIGLIGEDGYWFATYSYDAWGNTIENTVKQSKSYLANVNHIGYKGYYRDSESDFYYTGKGYYVPKLCRTLNADEPLNILQREENIRNAELNYNNYTYSNGNPISLPTDGTGYERDYDINQQVEVCETSSLLFESMNTFNTNCYGFAINCWRFQDTESTIEPGMTTSDDIFGTGSKYVSCITVADYVKKDIENWGKDARILTGKDNNPYYETDDKHCLIAVRTMGYYNFSHSKNTDSYHFMIRKDDGWYFKSGWLAGIFKLKENYTPDTVNWSQYEYSKVLNRYIVAYDVDRFYESEIQYMVIPKMPLRVE